MKALHVAEPQISDLKNRLQTAGEVEIAGMAGQRVFSVPDLGGGRLRSSQLRLNRRRIGAVH
jgi:hypothetical protein